MEFAAIIVVIVVALGFDYTNGFHDAANAIATSVSTRALAPRTALIMAAVMNLVGAFLGTAVASTVGSGIIDAPTGVPGLVVVLAALLGRDLLEPRHLVLRHAVVVVTRPDRRPDRRRARVGGHRQVERGPR